MVLIQLERNGALSGVHGFVRPTKNLTWPALSETLIEAQKANEKRTFTLMPLLSIFALEIRGRGQNGSNRTMCTVILDNGSSAANAIIWRAKLSDFRHHFP